MLFASGEAHMAPDTFSNLTQHRSEVDGWQPKGWWDSHADEEVTLSLASMVGASLLLYGVTRRRSDSSLLWILGGASLLGFAATGLAAWPWLRARLGAGQPPADLVTVESRDSFPASDAPSSNATTAAPQPLRSGDGR